MSDEFDVLEGTDSGGASFDLKKFFFNLIKYWKLFLVLLIASGFFVYQKNIREEFSYRLSTKISIEEDSNPLFTSNASLTFNWGGVTSKVQTMVVTLKSRSYHEKVIERLQFYKSYLKQGRFRKQDIYKAASYRFNHDLNEYQLLDLPIKITFLDSLHYELEVEFLEDRVSIQNYQTKGIKSITVNPGIYKKSYKLFEKVDLPFLKGIITPVENSKIQIGQSYFIQFRNFDNVVASYTKRMAVTNSKNSPILDITLIDKNTSKIVDYLNMVVTVLSEDQLNRKNQYATNTIAFIDKQLLRVKGELSGNAEALNDFRRKEKVFGLSDENVILNEKLTNLEDERTTINSQLNYYNNLKNYLITSNTFTDIPAPSIAGIEDTNILGNVSKINELSVQKSKLQYSVRKDATVFNDLNRRIEGLKNVLLENISSVSNVLKRELQISNSKLYKIESKFNKLPEQQQELLTMKRQYSLSEQTYNVFLAKRGEAEIIKASNVSDILIVDSAKNTGATVLGRNLNIRYVFAFFVALFIPVLLAFLKTVVDNRIHDPIELDKLSDIPVLGIVGYNDLDNNLVVHREPQSSISESFRGIRSSLQFFYKKHNLKGTKTVMITSSVGGEGKTFCSINIATVFAMSGKKTVLLGLDLRKPKIFGDFDIKNDTGVVNYLIGNVGVSEITQQTKVINLDVITSGPVPPNPSELLMGNKMRDLMDELKENYDFIVLDTPPIGLVTDAIELVEYTDVNIYIVREDYTKRDMMNPINIKYDRGEIQNLSIVYNGYTKKGKYGYGNYSYGAYANTYHNNPVVKLSFKNRLKRLLKLI